MTGGDGPRNNRTRSFYTSSGAGIAIGAAWGGLLSNFAAGAFILVLRPFKVGDYVLAGEVEGTVRAIGLFTTAIDHRQRDEDTRAGCGDHLQRARPRPGRTSVRPYRPLWQVYFDTNRVISETFGAAGYPAPEAHIRYHNA